MTTTSGAADMNNVVSILSTSMSNATSDPAMKPVFVAATYLIDESEEALRAAVCALLAAVRIGIELKACISTQNLPELHAAAIRYQAEINLAEKKIGQSRVMAEDQVRLTTKAGAAIKHLEGTWLAFEKF